MRDSDSREVVLSGEEVDLVEEALEHHDAEDGDTEALDELESHLDVDLDETEDGRFEFTRAAARIVISALEEYEPLVEADEKTRLEELREEFVDGFEFDAQQLSEPNPREDEEYPGST